MKVSLNWLQDYVALDVPVADITHAITFLGFEVEGVAATGAPKLEHVVVGEVRTREKHPNADKLSVCQVDVGPAGGVKTIVCGAQNYQVGDRVPVALPGAVLPGNFVIRQSKIRGQLSDGMMCAGRELGVPDEADGLLILASAPGDRACRSTRFCPRATRSSTSRSPPTAPTASLTWESPANWPPGSTGRSSSRRSSSRAWARARPIRCSREFAATRRTTAPSIWPSA